jgi:predicted DNA binding protein
MARTSTIPVRGLKSAKKHIDSADRLVVRYLRLKLPQGVWSAEISKRYPDKIIEITNWMEWTRGKALVDVRFYDAGSWDCAKELRAMEDVFRVEDCSAGTTNRDLHMIVKTPFFIPVFRRFGVMQKTPARIVNGESLSELVGTEAMIQQMITYLHEHSVSASLDHFYRNADGTGIILGGRDQVRKAKPSSHSIKGTRHLVVCRLRLRLPAPSWLHVMTTRHPETSFDVLGYEMVGNRTRFDIMVHIGDITGWVNELRSLSDVTDVTPLGSTQIATTLRVEYNGYGLISECYRLHLILRTPCTVREGTVVMVLAGPEENIREFATKFHDLGVQVEAVYHSEGKERSLLTPRQSEIFHRALAAGYFEVPRRVTLTELAAMTGVAVSSLSEMLAVVEKKLLQESQAAMLH